MPGPDPPRTRLRLASPRLLLVCAALGLACTLATACVLGPVALARGWSRHATRLQCADSRTAPGWSGSISRTLFSDAVTVSTTSSRLALDDESTRAPRIPSWAVIPAPEPGLFRVDTGGWGWPLRAMASESWMRDSRGVTSETLRHTFTLLQTREGRIMMPLRPIWTGILADTLVFAFASWCLITTSRWARLARRRRLGRCPACGYDRRTLAPGSPCPECGA